MRFHSLLLLCLCLGIAYAAKIPPTDDDVGKKGSERAQTTKKTSMERAKKTSPTSRRGAKSGGKNKRGQISLDLVELEETIFLGYKKIDDDRNKCKRGQYYEMVKKSCEDCKDDCESESYTGNCGMECRDFYREKAKDEAKNKEFMGLTIAVIAVGLLGIVVLILLVVAYRRFSRDRELFKEILKKMDGFEARNKPKNPYFDSPTDSAKTLLSNTPSTDSEGSRLCEEVHQEMETTTNDSTAQAQQRREDIVLDYTIQEANTL